jgi:endogenous inhibitor of DNA gyrase (YacG/DUF329 family)
MTRKYYCPQCGKPTSIAVKEFPFCSKRCKLFDLGAWASEKFIIEGSSDEDSATIDQEKDQNRG